MIEAPLLPLHLPMGYSKRNNSTGSMYFLVNPTSTTALPILGMDNRGSPIAVDARIPCKKDDLDSDDDDECCIPSSL